MLFDYFAICAPGLVRLENQDNLYLNGIYRKDNTVNSVFKRGDRVKNRGLFAVADGMGGEQHGELAALVTVQDMSKIELPRTGKDADGNSSALQNLTQYLLDRNADICDIITANNGARSGSTFAGIFFNERNADIINIGDSRIYLMRGGVLSQLSRDHTSVQQMLDLGVITKEAARSHPDRHKLTQHLGIFPSEMVIEPFTTVIPVEENDLFMLCSDGLTDMLDDSVIEGMLKAYDSVEHKAEILYSAAQQYGGRDNITVLLVQARKRGLLR